MEPVSRVARGLRRWTAWHDEWNERVGAVAVDTDDGLVLVDPLAAPRALRKPAHVLLTVFWHTRACAALHAPHVWAAERGVRRLRNRGVDVTDPIGPDTALPGGVRAFQTARDAELVFWLPAQRALVVGDVLLGAGAKPRPTADPLRLCPERWLGDASHDDLRESLRPVLELPVSRVLVSHGEPVLRAGRRALAEVLAPSGTSRRRRGGSGG